ncbi:hypothetical protein JTB14_027958 [Gonioctena quinquepunctata]|nr:hypothetical protein JTB14_027958 [Gonioctena quinquepunctata]
MLIGTTTDLHERTVNEKNYNQHLAMAEQAYNEKKRDKIQSLNTENIVFLSFDLEKCLATPMLQNNVSFYKRSLWTYNLTIYSCVNKKKYAICYIWDESLGGRGGQEIASCLRHYILSLPESVTEINMFSDCCSGQTRNNYFSVMLSLLMEDFNKNGRSIVINHKFLEPGHTHQEADTIHGAIEKVKKYILDFKSCLKSHYVHRKINTDKETINWLQIRWLQYRTELLSQIGYETSFTSENFKILDLSSKRKNTREAYSTRRLALSSGASHIPKDSEVILTPISTCRIPLPEKKVKDLKDLMPYVSEVSKYFYEYNIFSQPTVPVDEEYLPDERVYEDDE